MRCSSSGPVAALMLVAMVLQCGRYAGAVGIGAARAGAGAWAEEKQRERERLTQSPGAIIVKSLVALKEMAAGDLRQGGDAWALSRGRCDETVAVLQREADLARARQKDVEARLAVTRAEFNATETRVQAQRGRVEVLSGQIRVTVHTELPKATGKLQTATVKLNEAVAAAAPENQRLTAAIVKVDRIIDSIMFSSGAGLEDVPPANATEPAADEAASAAAGPLLLLDVATEEPEPADVGPRFAAALVKLHELKHGIAKLRNNSLEAFEIRRQHAEDQMHYQTEQIKHISAQLNATKRELGHSSGKIVRMENRLQNLTRQALEYEIQLPQIRDNVRRSNEAIVEIRTFCRASHDDYGDGKKRAQGVAEVADELTEMVTARLAKIQEALTEARLMTLDSAVARAEREAPASYKRLYNDIRKAKAKEEQRQGETFVAPEVDDERRESKGPVLTGHQKL